MSAATQHPHDVLLVDQEDQDVAILQAAISRSSFADLHVIGDTGQALAYLHHRGQYAEAPTPRLIVIDASRAERHGFDVLVDVMNDQALHSIPVIVLVEGEQEALPSFFGGRWTIVERPLDEEKIDALLESLGRDVFGE